MRNLLEDIIFKDIIVCAEIYSSKGKRRNIANRNSYGLIFSTCGKVNYYHNNKIYSTDLTSFIFVPKGVSYQLICEKEDNSIVVNFDCNIESDHFIGFKINNKNTLEIAKEIIDVYTQRPLGWKNIIRCHLYSIITSQLEIKNTHNYPTHLARCIECIERNYTNNKITNEMIAKYANISGIYMQKEFVKYLNISPHKYLCNIRINKAKILLSSSYLSVSEIAYQVGFSSVYDFSRTFKKATKTSPLNYRKTNLIHT